MTASRLRPGPRDRGSVALPGSTRRQAAVEIIHRGVLEARRRNLGTPALSGLGSRRRRLTEFRAVSRSSGSEGTTDGAPRALPLGGAMIPAIGRVHAALCLCCLLPSVLQAASPPKRGSPGSRAERLESLITSIPPPASPSTVTIDPRCDRNNTTLDGIAYPTVP